MLPDKYAGLVAYVSLVVIVLLAPVDPLLAGQALYHRIKHVAIIVTVSLSE